MASTTSKATSGFCRPIGLQSTRRRYSTVYTYMSCAYTHTTLHHCVQESRRESRSSVWTLGLSPTLMININNLIDVTYYYHVGEKQWALQTQPCRLKHVTASSVCVNKKRVIAISFIRQLFVFKNFENWSQYYIYAYTAASVWFLTVIHWHVDTRATHRSNNTNNKVVYRLPATGSRSPGIPCRQSTTNDSLAPKPSPNPML